MATVARVVVHRLIERFIVGPPVEHRLVASEFPFASDKQILSRVRFVADSTRKGGATGILAKNQRQLQSRFNLNGVPNDARVTQLTDSDVVYRSGSGWVLPAPRDIELVESAEFVEPRSKVWE
jgi:hypothetical protein